MSKGKKDRLTRRDFLTGLGRGASLLAVGGALGALSMRWGADGTVWQIDPFKCTRCGRCTTDCVLDDSAVKCVHQYAMCGYCRLCFGFFQTDPVGLDEAAENQMCPLGAIKRTFIEEPYYEYIIDEELCNGCGKCVEGCEQFGNGSLYLQVRHDRCVNCNECLIAMRCPSDAFIRLPVATPYMDKASGPGHLISAVRGE